MMRSLALPVVGLSLLAACSASQENVTFVTATQLDIGYDTSIGNLNIGYDRNELMIGPAYVDTGGVPPVAAAIQSNLSLLNPKITQVYATGNAALLATADEPTLPDQSGRTNCTADSKTAGNGTSATDDDRVGCSNALVGRRRALVFGTSSNLGLKVAFATTGASSVSLGYKRRELSVIPLRKSAERDDDTPDAYASVFGSMSLDTTVSTGTETVAQLGQFFATGRAAEELATRSAVRKSFGAIADKAAQTDLLTEIGAQEWQGDQSEAAAVAACVQSSDTAFTDAAKARLAKLVDAAALSGSARTAVLGATSGARLQQILLNEFTNARQPLYAAATAATADCDK